MVFRNYLYLLLFLFNWFKKIGTFYWYVVYTVFILSFLLWQLNREPGKISPTMPFLSVPRIGETDTDTLTEIPDHITLPHDTVEEEEDEFGYTWSKSCFSTSAMTHTSPPEGSVATLESHKNHWDITIKHVVIFEVLNLPWSLKYCSNEISECPKGNAKSTKMQPWGCSAQYNL